MGHARADYSSSHDDLSSTGGERNTDRQKEVLREEDLREGEGDGERVELYEKMSEFVRLPESGHVHWFICVFWNRDKQIYLHL